MQELIIDVLLVAVVLAAAFFLVSADRGKNDMTKKQKTMLKRILIASALLLGLQLLSDSLFVWLDAHLFPSAGRWGRFALYLADYFIIGHDILRKAARGVMNRRVFDENFLMAVATVGAMVLAVSSNGDYFEAIAVMLFYQIGEWFQSYAVGKSRRSISELMDIRPDHANIERDGRLEQVDPDEVEVGSIIIVQPGEKVPIDGVIREGRSTLNTSALTGESLPREIGPGDEIISGCINMTGVLKIETTKEFGASTVSKILDLVENASSKKSRSENFISKFAKIYTPIVVLKIETTKEFGASTVSKILDLVENASSKKSRSENFISKFAKIYTPIVCYSALALALLPPLVRALGMGLAPEWGVWIYRALTFLIISCPCALVISIPLSFFAGIGGASQAGVLVKGSNYLETLSKVRTVVFDKTGTLTQGVFEVNDIHHSELEREQLLEYAALAESASSHPISKSLQRACGKALDRSRVTDIREISGNGVIAHVDGLEVAAGNDKLMRTLGIPYKDCHSTGTIIHMAVGGQYAGHIVISDIIKPSASEAIRALKKAGVEQTVMLTGDTRKVAEQVAEELGLDGVYSELLPADKVAKVEELLDQKNGRSKLAFVGDGINDAPVLSRADIGIAMGAMGSDAAIEAADVVLMDDDPMKIAKAIRISRKCLGIVYQNIALALGIKFVCLLLGAVGEVNMYMAIFADVGVMILAVLNAIRCLFVKDL